MYIFQLQLNTHYINLREKKVLNANIRFRKEKKLKDIKNIFFVLILFFQILL